MTAAGRTAQPLQPAVPFARSSAVVAAGLGCLALAVVAASSPLASTAGQQSAQTVATSLVALAVAVSTLAAAAAFNPVRRRVQHLVDRRFNRARYGADLIVAAFAARLQDAVDFEAVRADLGSTVQRAREPEHMSVWTWEA
jgi:hypothetical protein